MTFFGLELGLDLEMRAAHPHQKFQGVLPPGVIHTMPWSKIFISLCCTEAWSDLESLTRDEKFRAMFWKEFSQRKHCNELHSAVH